MDKNEFSKAWADPTKLKGNLAGVPYEIGHLDDLLPKILGGRVIVYQNTQDFKPAVEGVRVTGYAPQKIDPDKAIMTFNSDIYVSPREAVSNHLGQVLNSVLRKDTTIISTEKSQLTLRHLLDQVDNDKDATEQDKYEVVNDKGISVGSIYAPVSAEKWVNISAGWWRNEGGLFVRKFPKEEIRNLGDVSERLKITMDITSFVIKALTSHFLSDDDLAPPTVPDPEPAKKTPEKMPEPTQERESIDVVVPQEQTAIDNTRKVMLENIGGLDHIKEIFEEIITFSKHPEMAARWGTKKPQNVLLYGPTGTGKTMLATALANELGAELRVVAPDDIYDSWLGNSQKNIKKIFTEVLKATAEKPIVLFFDEIDGIVSMQERPGSGGADSERNGVATIFKQQLGVITQKNPNIYIVAATNEKERIDPAIIRSGRFDYQLYIPLPNEEGRRQIFANYIADVIIRNIDTSADIFEGELDIAQAAKDTDNLSGADITEIMRRVLQRKVHEEIKTGNADPISNKDLSRAIKAFKTNG